MKVIVSFIILATLVGCMALKKRESQPAFTKEVNVNSAVDQALSGNNFISVENIDRDWWNSFEDEQLTHLMESAIMGNPDLKAAVARVRSSEEEARKVGSVLFPFFSASFEDDYQHLSADSIDRFPPSQIPAVVNQLHLRLNFEYEIDLFGKNRETYRAAVGQANAMRAERSQAYLMITISLAEAYFNYQMYLQSIYTQKQIIESQKSLIYLTKKRVENKLDDQIDLNKVEADLLLAEETLVNLEKDLAVTESQIKILMGMGPDDPLDLKLPHVRFNRPFPIPENLSLNLISRRPDLMMQIWQVEAAAHLIGAARAAFFPNINLSAFVGLESLTWNKLLSIQSFAGSLAPAINLPLFTGFRLRAGLEQAFANYDAAVFDYNSLILKASKEVTDGLSILKAANETGSLQQVAVDQYESMTHLTVARFENGVSNLLEVQQMKLQLLDQMQSEIQVQNVRHLAVLSLIRALGGGYQSMVTWKQANE